MEQPRTKLKLLLGIKDDSKDEILDFVIEKTTEMICNYCRVEAVPLGLKAVFLDMCVDVYRAESLGQEMAEGTLKSITEGGVSVSLQSPYSTADNASMVFLRNYTEQLNRYRKVGF